MTNKQSAPAPSESEWDAKLELTSENLHTWLLGPFEKQRQALDEVKRRMQDEGVSSELIKRCISYESSPREKVSRETLKLVTNSKTGKLWDIPTLQNAGKLSNAEIEGIKAEHQGQEPPYYYISHIRRILDDRSNPPKEYLTYNWMFEGLSVGKREGHITSEPNMRINASGTIGYHVTPRITWNTLQDKDGEDKRVASFDSTRTPILDDISTRIYDLQFRKDLVEALLKHTMNGEVSFGITQLSKGKHYGGVTMEEFLTDDLPGLIEQMTAPKPTINIDSKGLFNYLKTDAAAKGQVNQQYG